MSSHIAQKNHGESPKKPMCVFAVESSCHFLFWVFLAVIFGDFELETLLVHRWKGPWSLHFWLVLGLSRVGEPGNEKGTCHKHLPCNFLSSRPKPHLTDKPCPQSGSLGVLAKWPGKFWFWMNNSMFFSKENPTLFWWIFLGEYLQLYVSFQIPLWVQRVCFGGKTCNLEV